MTVSFATQPRSRPPPWIVNPKGCPIQWFACAYKVFLLEKPIQYKIQVNLRTMTTRLNAANLNLLDQNIQVPKYDRQKVGQSIMHVGVGGFHRAHQALYMDDLLHQGGDSHWGYCGVGLLEHDARIRDVMLSQAFTRSWSGVWTATKLESL